MQTGFASPPEPFAEADACAFAMATMLIRIHGGQASAHALKAMRQRGNSNGAAFWFKTAYAIDAMTTGQNIQA
jgi:hypothetical protein